jgi:hypothetical protein
MFGLCKKVKGHCSCFFDSLFGKDWGKCCKKHDEDYKKLKKGDSTKSADLNFLECLKSKTWKPLAYVMYGVVRVFGRKFKGEI